MSAQSLESLPEHIRTPHLRPFQPIPVQKDGQQFIALRDPTMLVQQTMVVSPQAVGLLQHFQGNNDLAAIASNLNAPLDHLIKLAEGLDKVGLLWGPTSEELETKLRQRISSAGALTAAATANLGKDADACRRQIDEWLAESDDPELEGTVIGIVAPHLDYARGWPNYAAAYRCLDYAERPDRVVILGTNHYGIGDGVIVTEWGFETPMGRCETDNAVVEAMVEKLGRPLIVDQLDHVAEHSVQLQVPWMQHRWSDVPVVAALVPDPLVPMIEEDDSRISGDRFVEALRDTLTDVGGSTFYIASADLSHVGPQFGEPRQIDDQRRHDVELHDREMMGKYIDGDPEEFLAAFKWNNNPTRWCSIGNMLAAMQLLQPQEIELIDYRQACDEQGIGLVSSAAMAMM